MKRISILLVFVLIAVLVAACGSGAQEAGQEKAEASPDSVEATEEDANGSDDPIVIKFPFVNAADSPKGKAAELFKELAEERTDGRVQVEIYPSGQLYNDQESLEELPKNTIQLISITATTLVGYDPAFQIVDLPFLFHDDEAVYRFWDGEGGQMLGERLAEHNIKYLGFWANGFKQFANQVRPLTSPEDFHGLNFRTQAGQVLEAQFEALGAASLTLPLPDVYPALQQGTIDGIENTFNNIDVEHFHEVTNYLTASNHGRIDYMFLSNVDFWDGLPDDIRSILEEIVTEVTEQQRIWAKELDDASYETLKEAGDLEIYELTEEDKQAFQEAMQPVYDQFSDAIGEDLIEMARQANE